MDGRLRVLFYEMLHLEGLAIVCLWDGRVEWDCMMTIQWIDDMPFAVNEFIYIGFDSYEMDRLLNWPTWFAEPAAIIRA